MGFVMMRQMTKDAILMVGIAVAHVLLKVIAQNVYVSSLMLMNTILPIHWLEMGTAMMRPTILIATLMVETVVDLA